MDSFYDKDLGLGIEDTVTSFISLLFLIFFVLLCKWLDIFPISDLSVKRKIEKHREKVLRSDSVLQRNAFVQPVPSSTKKKSNTKRKESQIPKEPAEDGPEVSNLFNRKRKR